MKRLLIVLLALLFPLAFWAHDQPVKTGKGKGKKKKAQSGQVEKAPAAQGQAGSEVAFSGFSWESGEMIEISADKMNLSINERKAVFKDRVIVKKGGSVIYCDQLQVRYVEEGQIDWLKAEGGVKIVEGDQFASGDELEYFKAKNQFYLRGKPKLVSKGQIVLGTEMIFDLANNRLKVSNPEIQFQKEKP